MIDSSQSEQQFGDTCETRLSSFCTVPLEDSRVHVCLRHTVAAHTSPSENEHWRAAAAVCTDSPLSNWSFLYLCIISVATMHSIYRGRGEERWEGNKQVIVNIYSRSCEERLHIQSANIIFRTMSNSNFYKIGTCHLFTNKAFHADRKRRIRLPGCIQGAFPGPLKVKCTHLLGN